ncbi:LPXTG cell wall anchor domain-containing protein [Enterococcus sp. DIV1368e]|uniref:LPXTG cell wall anchor domain-containing protein n=1 Tax=unclassified Enterococcus TaxID=2608891 RepID=UPI003F24CFCE
MRIQDGREAIESMDVTIVPDEGLQLELSPASVQGRYSVDEQGAEDKPGASEEGAGSESCENGESGQDDRSDLEATGNLPQTNATRNTLLSVIGTMLLALVGGIFFWKKRSTEKLEKEANK